MSVIRQGAKRQKRDFETQCHIMKVAIKSSLGKKDYKPFQEEKESYKKISSEDKAAEIARLKEVFNF